MGMNIGHFGPLWNVTLNHRFAPTGSRNSSYEISLYEVSEGT
jgi:hypothetical protein